VKLIRNIAILFFLVTGSAQSQNGGSTLDLPDMGDSTGTIMSPEFERRLGQAFLSQIRRQTNLINDPEVEAYIQSIGYRLVSQSDNNSQVFTFFVINDPLINAFAAPGGIVGINSGVIMNSDSESELAGVVAHEIAHVTQKHMARSYEMQSQMSVPMMAAMLGAILIATQDPEAGQAALIAIQGGSAQAQINFTRNNEAEADRVGMQLLARSEFNPQGMPAFFEKLQSNARYGAQAPEFLRTHPLSTNRISDTRSRAANYPRDFRYHESLSYPFIKAKLVGLNYRNPNDAVAYFKDRLEKEPFSNESIPLRYGLALALTQAGKFDEAADHIYLLLNADPENPTFMIAAAEMESKSGNLPKAVELYDKAIALFPDYRPVALNYSRILLENRKPERAKEILTAYGKYAEPDLTYYQFLSRAEAESGNEIESQMASAEHFYLSGETAIAMQAMRSLLRSRNPAPDFFQRERIQDRLAFFEQELQLERKMNLRK
jgi:predicted Zn-dependent protease